MVTAKDKTLTTCQRLFLFAKKSGIPLVSGCGTILPHDGGTYKQAPFEDCDEVTYIKLLDALEDIDLSKVIEIEDNTDLKGELACAGGACEVS